MKLLIAGDIHGDEKALRSLLSKKFDYLVLLGDLTNAYQERHLFDLLPQNVFFVPGNNEPKEAGLHGVIKEVEDYKFLFLGGSTPTPFGTLNEISQEEYEDILLKIWDLVDEKTIIFSHNPPYGALDAVGNIRVGIVALRKLILEKKPLAVFCGHIHEYAGNMAFIGSTPVYNPGKSGLLLHL